MENKDKHITHKNVSCLKSYRLLLALIMFVLGLITLQKSHAENPYIDDNYVKNKTLEITEEIFSVVEEVSDNIIFSQSKLLHYDLIDAILQDRRDSVRLVLEQPSLLNEEHIQYFKASENLLNLSAKSAIATEEYDLLKSGLKSDYWKTRHLSALLLVVVHTKASDAVEALQYAEKALSEIPTDNNIYAPERFYAHWALYMSFVIDGDLNRTLSNIKQMLAYSKLSGWRVDEFALINNMAVMLDKSGDLDTAIKLTSILTKRAVNGDAQNKFIANFSHGRFLLKADQHKEALLYLERALNVTQQDFYKAYIHVDLATAYSKLGEYEKAAQSLEYINENKETLGNAAKYSNLHINQSEALIAASKGDYKTAFNLIRRYSDQQIRFYKDGLSVDRREANRRVLLTEEIAKKNLEKAELQSKLAQETVAKQKAKGRLYLALIAIGFVMTMGSGLFLRKVTKLNKKLKEANEEIAEKSKVKTDLLAMFSHEMLTPLNGIVPLADVLQKGESDPKKKKLLKMIEMSGTELTRKMKDIVLVANPDGQSTNPVSVDVERFLYESLSQFHDHTPDDVDLTVQMGKDVPQYLKFDVERVRAAISALLSNSLKYTDQGRVVLSLYLNGAGRTVIDVMDTGTGIDPARLDDMSKPFGQKSLSITRENQGLGLGLTIVRLQCLIMGADFQMESQPGLGTSIRIILPEDIAGENQGNTLQDAA